ncbi:MAG: hypothetical protein V4612_07755 [Pseudomonadota bacterium]
MSRDNHMNSADLYRISESLQNRETASQPPTGASGFPAPAGDAPKTNPLFNEHLKPLAGVGEVGLDQMLSGLGDDVSRTGIFADVKEANMANVDVAAVFGGTIFSQGNIGHEGYDFKVSGDVAASHIAPSAQFNIGNEIDVMGKGGGSGHGGGH